MTAVRAAPDIWRAEYPLTGGIGVCPRGSALGELLTHRRRIREARRRSGEGHTPIDIADAARRIADAAAASGLTILLDGNLPLEQLAQAAAWCRAWGGARLCFVVEPAEEELLLGLEAASATYLPAEELAACDGFVIVGDAFAANPTCARGVLDRCKGARRPDGTQPDEPKPQPRTPIVVIDPAGGTAAKFATHRVECGCGMELSALSAVAAAAGADVAAEGAAEPSAAAAGKALSGCERLGVLIAAEYGRTDRWRQIGYVAGRLAAARGGGVAVQTNGANALAAVRMGPRVGAVRLAEAMSGSSARVAIGCDVAGMLGVEEAGIFAAAGAMPNRTTAAAEIVLPLAMPGEYAGRYLISGVSEVSVSPLLPPPAGVPTAAELVGALASAAGVGAPAEVTAGAATGRLDAEAPPPAPAGAAPDGMALLFARRAMHAGCGELTGHGSWQGAIEPVPEVRVSPADAEALKLKNLGTAEVRANGAALAARVRVAPELPAGRVVLPEANPRARVLNPANIDGTVAAVPLSVSVS
jgi:hypothetical protein